MQNKKSSLDFLKKTRDRLKSLRKKESQEVILSEKIEGELDLKSFTEANPNIHFPQAEDKYGELSEKENINFLANQESVKDIYLPELMNVNDVKLQKNRR